MARPRKTPGRGTAGHVIDVRFVEVEFAAPIGTRMIIELDGGVRLLLADSGGIELAAELIRSVRCRRKGGRK